MRILIIMSPTVQQQMIQGIWQYKRGNLNYRQYEGDGSAIVFYNLLAIEILD